MTPHGQLVKIDCREAIRRSYGLHEDDEILEVLTASLAPTTQAQYRNPLNDWIHFCASEHADPFKGEPILVARFLMNLYMARSIRHGPPSLSYIETRRQTR